MENADGKLGYSAYRKPTHIDYFLNASSHRHSGQKSSLITILVKREIRIYGAEICKKKKKNNYTWRKRWWRMARNDNRKRTLSGRLNERLVMWRVISQLGMAMETNPIGKRSLCYSIASPFLHIVCHPHPERNYNFLWPVLSHLRLATSYLFSTIRYSRGYLFDLPCWKIAMCPVQHISVFWWFGQCTLSSHLLTLTFFIRSPVLQPIIVDGLLPYL